MPTTYNAEKAQRAPVFFYHQSGLDEGPYYSWQIQAMLRNGTIRADAQLRQEDGAFISIEDFIKRFGCLTEEENLESLNRRLTELSDRSSGIRWAVYGVWFTLLIILLFGFKIVAR
jgi:hypothetical protein